MEAERGERDDVQEKTQLGGTLRTMCGADEEGGLRGDLQMQI